MRALSRALNPRFSYSDVTDCSHRTEGTAMIAIKRAYDPPARTDGNRILVYRLWPRGIKKDEAHV